MNAVNAVRSVVVVGGGTAGWMSAAAFAKALDGSVQIRLLESDEIGIIGVGEASIPNLTEFNRALGVDEDEFLRATQGSFKMGIEFVNWGAVGERYVHGFGRIGQPEDTVPFHQFWLRMAQQGKTRPLGEYAINTAAPREARFMRARTDMSGSPLAEIAHAYHFDASLYARFLRHYAEQRGVRRTEGKVAFVEQHENGHIAALRMENGERITGDFFIDCTGMRALLIGQTLKAGYEDWSHWLPCDRAIAVPCERADPLLPMTRSTAHTAGWQWRIPLQHRTGNGHVYSSRFMDAQQAEAILLAGLDGQPTAAPRHLSFRTGRASRFWIGNCVAVGLSSGFLEPLESTSIHLVHMAIARILEFFPSAGFDATDIDEYNVLTCEEFDNVRDFLVLHYKLTRRDDSPFWNHCRQMEVPGRLARKMALFASNGRVYRRSDELFAESSWLQVLIGQGLMPRGHHPFADLPEEAEVLAYLENVRQVVGRCVQVMPLHADFINRHCAARAIATVSTPQPS
ncbi:tryptophan halogenase family protein [Roseateles sp.]|uniref:tryptophan halogenase family protein n=1 Tax=Roseateles sp. TaxID=1971397 RepID=UPI0025CED19D|nr:tryptophan halogenase family protein [Roseateles sp.]MBV8034791.1 tryptophan 7-halogenase [Roseateles sp.]